MPPDRSWLFTILTVAAGQTFSAVYPIAKGETLNPKEVRRAYALSLVFIGAAGIVLAIAMDSTEPIVASVALLIATIAVQEWAIAIQSVEQERPSNSGESETA